MLPVQWMYWWSVEKREEEERRMPRSWMQLTKPNLKIKIGWIRKTSKTFKKSKTCNKSKTCKSCEIIKTFEIIN